MPDNPLKAVNSYLVIGDERNLLIDTGFNHPLSQKTLLSALREVDSPLERTDIFVTHAHVDHAGMAPDLKRSQNQLFCSEEDGKYLNPYAGGFYSRYTLGLSALLAIPRDRRMSGEDLTDPHRDNHAPEKTVDITVVKEPDHLRVGDFDFEVIDMPGHSPAHIGLYERSRRMLFCGDHILENITPNLSMWGCDRDYVHIYTQSLKKVRTLDVELLFPGHRGIITEPRKRIDELIDHHVARTGEILDALRRGSKTVYDVAGNITWHINGGNISDYAPEQLWFAASETFAHLEHLRYIGIARRCKEAGAYYYTLAGNADMADIRIREEARL